MASCGSGSMRTPVASPASVCRRQTKPGEVSATALIGASSSMKGRICSESSGALRRPTLTWAR